MRQKRKQRATKYHRVVLAVYWLADETGSLCIASNAEIAAEAGCLVKVVVKHLRAMEAKGVICRLPPDRHYGNRCPIFIMDSPTVQADLARETEAEIRAEVMARLEAMAAAHAAGVSNG